MIDYLNAVVNRIFENPLSKKWMNIILVIILLNPLIAHLPEVLFGESVEGEVVHSGTMVMRS